MDQLEKPEVWMARVIVVPREGCDLLDPDKGAYVNVLTLAANGSECRVKIATAMNHNHLEVVGIEGVFLFSDSSDASAELATIAQELKESGNLKHVRFETLHTFPRVI